MLKTQQYKAKFIRRIGNSFGVILPKEALELLSLDLGQRLRISVYGNALLISKDEQPPLTPEEGTHLSPGEPEIGAPSWCPTLVASGLPSPGVASTGLGGSPLRNGLFSKVECVDPVSTGGQQEFPTSQEILELVERIEQDIAQYLCGVGDSEKSDRSQLSKIRRVLVQQPELLSYLRELIGVYQAKIACLLRGFDVVGAQTEPGHVKP
jgi:hypothetical protein